MKCSFFTAWIAIAIIIMANPAQSQSADSLAPLLGDGDALLESLAEDAAAGAQAAETLAKLAEQPINVNRAGAIQLGELPMVTPGQARAIVSYRKENGPYSSLASLKEVPGLSADLLQRAAPYLRTGESRNESKSFLQKIEGSFLQRVARRIDVGRGYLGDTSAYAGSPWRSYTRVRLNAGGLRMGLALEKDPGEALLWAPGRGMFGYDHWSGFISWQGDSWLEKLVLGNFGVQFGQGMLLWSGVSFGKGRYAVHPLLRSGGGISPFASSRESGYLRGVAATLRPASTLRISLFASRQKRDASLDTADTGRAIGSLPASGLHRTLTERARRNNVRHTVAGGALEWRNYGWLVGMAGYGSRFSLPLATGSRPDEYFDRSGSTLGGFSLYGNGSLGPGYLYFEIMRDRAGTLAAVGGAHMTAGRGADVLLSLRHYPESFRSMKGSAFSAGSGAPSNESGAYLGLRIQLHRRWTLSAYADYYQFPYLRYQTPGPSGGLETRLVITHQWREWLNWYVQLRSETREASQHVLTETGRIVDGLGAEMRQSVRLHGSYRFNEDLRLRARLEISRYRMMPYAAEHGLILYHQLRWQPLERLTLYGRITVFDVESYGSRLYAYENGPLYGFSVPVFQGMGRRYFVFARLNVTERGTLEAKWSVSQYDNMNEIGSGWELLEGGRRRAFSLQLRWRL